MRLFLPFITLCLLANLAGAAVVNTDIDLRNGGEPGWNAVSTAAVNSTENTITVKVSAGSARTVQFVSNDTAWYYRSSTSGTNFAVAAGQTLTLRFAATTVVYFTRQTADGNLLMLPLLQPGDK